MFIALTYELKNNYCSFINLHNFIGLIYPILKLNYIVD